jgi:tetratricopeptide (TPR) repeat protein
MKQRLVMMVLLASGMCACSTSGGAKRSPVPPSAQAEIQADSDLNNDPKKTRQVQLDLIRGMLEKRQYYAALAYIEEQKRLGESSNELVLLEADSRRHLDQVPQAEVLYRKLVGTSLEGQAYHGLGLLYVATDINAAIVNLQKASQLLPTNVEIRGDLGYALMEAGRYTEAMPELSTAAELAPGQVKGRNNLIILLLLTGNDASASKLAQQSATGPDTLNRLREEAQQIRNRQNTRTAKAAS